MPAIPLPDQDSSNILSSARADAVASLRNAGGQGPAYADQLGAHMPPTPAASLQGASTSGGASAPPDESYTAAPPPDAVDMTPAPPVVPHPAATDMPPAQQHGNGDPWSLQNMGEFLRDEFKGSAKEIGYGIIRGVGKAASAGITLGAGAAAAVADHVAGALLGTNGQAKNVNGAEDAVFDFKTKFWDPAVDSWTPPRQTQTGEGDGSGGAAQGLGGAAEVLPAMAAGPAGLGSLITSAGVNSATGALDQGLSLRSSVATGAVDAIGTAIQAMVPGHSLALAKRLMVQVPAGDIAALIQDYTKKQILQSAGHQQEADAIDPVANLGQDTLQNIVFGLLGGKKGEGKDATAAAPPPNATEMPPGEPVPPAGAAPPPPVAPAPAASSSSTPAAAAPTPPSGAQAARAALRDMNDPATPRQGVFLTADTQQALFSPGSPASKHRDTVQRQMQQARATGRVIDIPEAGSLIVKDKATALKIQAQLKAGADPKSIVDQVTGAAPPDTAVPMPPAAPAPAAAAPVGDGTPQGKLPSTASWAKPAERPVETPAEPVIKPVTEAAKPPEAVAPPEAEEGETPEETAPSAQRGIVKTGAGERPVVIHDDTPDAEGKIRVSPIDDEGEAGPEIKVPADALISKTEKPQSAPTPEAGQARPDATENQAPAAVPEKPAASVEEQPAAPEKPPEAAAPEKPLTGLQKAMDQLSSQDTPPNGKRWVGKLPERASNISAFARALKNVAGKMTGDDAAHAVDMAKAAGRLDLKSPEAIAKNQGIGHTELNVHRENLLNAARKLIDPSFDRPEPLKVTQVKAQARAETKKAAPAEKPAPKEKAVDGKVPYPPPEGKGAPAYMEPAKRAVVDEMNGDITRAQLHQKFADLDMTTGQIRSVTNRIDWYESDTAKTQALREEGKTKVIADVEDETKPKQLTKGEQLKLAAAGKRLLSADDEHLDARTADIDRIIKEIYGPRLSDDERAAFIKSLTNERAERLRPKSRDDEIDEEFSDNGRMEDGDDELEHQTSGFRDVHPDIAALHKVLNDKGVYSTLMGGADKSQWKTRDVLDTMTKGATGAVRSLLQKISRNVPDESVIRPVTAVTGKDAAKTAGLFNPRNNVIQIRARDAADPMLTHTIIHEATHAATIHLMRGDPTHATVVQAKRLHQIFVDRLRSKYGDLVDQHIAYQNGTGPRPENFTNDLYGITNPAEHMAEVAANGKYRDLIAKSEKWKQPGEGWLGGAHDLARATFKALKNLLGLGDSEGSLLSSTMRNLEDTMEAQTNFLNEKADDAVSDFRSLAMLNEDPKPLKDEPRLRSVVGDTMATTARQFYRSVQSGALHAMRRLILANERHNQFTRTNAHWFGKDDDSNALRQWDSTKQDAVQIQNKILEHGRPAVLARQRLGRLEDNKLGQIQIESQQWGMDPTKDKVDQTAAAKKGTNFDARFDDFKRRFDSLSPAAKEVFHMESDHNKWSARTLRKAGVDAALDTFSDRDVTAAQRSLLYSARTKGDFDALIGQGKQIDVGDRNTDLTKTLQELSAGNQVQGHYFHLGRTGDYVVEVNPEVEREFDTQPEAEAHAAVVRETGPSARAKVTNLGGKWQVSGKATELSMHNSAKEAEDEADRLRAQGHDVGPITNKIEAESGGALSAATQNLVAAAKMKLERRGAGPETQALSDALRGTFVQMVADRSAYAASKLARKGFGGAKANEMGRNFAAHVQSSAWNIANLATTFKQGEALGKLRDAAKRPDAETPQTVVYKRGAVMREIGKRTQQEVSQYGLKNPTNAITAKLGYMNFLASPAHTLVNMTQNFTTGLPVAGARWGYGKSTALFAKASGLMAGPTFRAGMKAFAPGEFNAEDMVGHAIKLVAKDSQFGKWAPQLKQMLDRGGLNSSFANEIGHQGQGGNITVQRVFDYARILPQMAEVYNRISSALVALEATGGDVTKATDYVNEVHMNYAQTDQTRVMKTFSKIPGANTLTMFRTYTQGIFHLLYSNVKNMVTAESKSRGEAAKTVAGLILAQSLTAGVIKGAYIEPVRLAVYAYNQLFGSDDEYSDLDNTTRRFLADHLGDKAGDVVAGGLPHLLGFDLSSRMGLSDLLLHDPPDFLHADSKQMMQFLGTLLSGPMGQMVAEHKDEFMSAMQRGDAFGALSQIIPIKAVRDISQAFQLGTSGKMAGNGAQLTQPSGLDAVYRAIGLKPVSVEQAQEKEGSIVQYRGFIADRKQRLIKAYENTDDKGAVMSAISDYNATNPGNRIKPADLSGRGALRTQQDLEGVDKDPAIRDLTDY